MAMMVFSLLLAAQACATQDAAAPPLARDSVADCVPRGRTWRSIASEADRRRLRDWRDSWIEALAQSRGEGHGEAITAAGSLLDPDAALDGSAIAPGDYRCRTIKLGSRQPGVVPAFADEGFANCRIGAIDSRMTFARLGGTQRPIGRIYPDNELRSIFLGTLQLTDESRAYQYGVDPDRDMIGLIQRIGERRWRLVLPRPAHESLLDVIEIVPR